MAKQFKPVQAKPSRRLAPGCAVGISFAGTADLLLRTTQRLDLLVNWEKSELSLTWIPMYLGAKLDIQAQLDRPSPQRISTLMSTARSLRVFRSVSAKRLTRWLGYVASLVDVVPDCRLVMRPFQIHLLKLYRPNVDLTAV